MAFTLHAKPTLTSKQKEWANSSLIILADTETKKKYFGCKCGVRPIASIGGGPTSTYELIPDGFQPKAPNHVGKMENHLKLYSKLGRPHGSAANALAHWARTHHIDEVDRFLGVKGHDSFCCKQCGLQRSYKGLERLFRHAQGCLDDVAAENATTEDTEETVESACVRRLQISFQQRLPVVLEMPAGDATTVSDLMATVRRRWGATGKDDDDKNDDDKNDKHDDKRQVELWWDPPTHVSKDPLRLADGSKTVAELGLWDLDVVRADLVSAAQDDDATKAAQIACIVGAYEAMAVNQGPPTAIQRDLETLLRKHGWQPKKKKRRIHPQPVT